VTRRLNRLRRSGAIAREAAVVCEELIAARVTGLVMVQQTRSSPEVLAALTRQLAHRPQVQMMMAISGGYDLMLVIVERDMAAFMDFTDKVLGLSPYVHRFQASIVTARVKATLAVPLDERDAR
jgi:Lrp/AsnC family transcriptional regulator, leucine-responsive regulatory protein